MIRQKIESPSKSVRKYCLWCCTYQPKEVRLCTANLSDPVCPLWPIRFGRKAQGVSTLKAIRAWCLDCSAYNRAEVKRCQLNDCSLYPYRMGKNPNLSGKRQAPEALLNYNRARREGTQHVAISEQTPLSR